MAKSQYEYVKGFEQSDALLPQCWIVIRLDGKGFTKFCDLHSFDKPNDARALRLMDAAAAEVMQHFPDIRIAYGESDEYSFVFHKLCSLYGRRASKLTSLVASLFAAAFVRLWPQQFPDTALRATPCFDARAVCYPSDKVVRDYLSWRQVDTHVNNQYNTCFWALRQFGGLPAKDAQEALRSTNAAAKNEMLFSKFGINYNNLPARFRKGSVLIWQRPVATAEDAEALSEGAKKGKKEVAVLHVDLIGDAFWRERPELLA